MKNKFKMQDLDCAHCAAKMEEAIKEVCANEEFIKATEDAYCVTPTFVGTEDLKAKLDAEFADFTANENLITN